MSERRKEALDMLEEMIKGFENIPSGALSNFTTNYDLWAALSLIFVILKDEDIKEPQDES